METFLRPPPEVFAFLILQKFIYLQVLVVLSVFQITKTRDRALFYAFCALILSLLGLAAFYGPSILGLYTGPIPIIASKYALALNGLLPHLLASFAFFLSFQRRSWIGNWADSLHLLMFIALSILWLLSR